MITSGFTAKEMFLAAITGQHTLGHGAHVIVHFQGEEMAVLNENDLRGSNVAALPKSGWFAEVRSAGKCHHLTPGNLGEFLAAA